MKSLKIVLSVAALAAFLLSTQPLPTAAHCDTMDGPVVKAARAAIDSRELTPVLRWIQPEAETEIRTAFERTLKVRAAGEEARELADLYFFETLVRVHRAGEGEPYTGLKPAGSPVDPAVLAADHALETGSPDELVKLVSDARSDGLLERFRHAHEALGHADHDVEAGRRFVAAYVAFTHYAEQLRMAAARGPAHEAHAAPAAEEHHHQ